MSPIQKQLELSTAYFRIMGQVMSAQMRLATVLTRSVMGAPFAQVRAMHAAAARAAKPAAKAARPMTPSAKAALGEAGPVAVAPKPKVDAVAAKPAPAAVAKPAPAKAARNAPVKAAKPAPVRKAKPAAAKPAAAAPDAPRPRKTRSPSKPPALPEPAAKG